MINKISEKFFTGINYWDSKSAINMWDNFDIESIENDFKLLKDAGITHLRVFPLWSVFQPLCAIYGGDGIYEYSFGENPLPDTEAGKAGISEQACEKFEAFCTLAEKYDMKLVVALITGHMSGRTYNPPAFDGKALMSDPTVLKWQIRFVKYFVKRFKEQSAIVGWDLGNESIYIPGKTDNPDTFYVWASIISDAAKSVDSTHPIISGLDNSSIESEHSNLKTIGEMCDVHTTHPYNIFQTNTDPLNTMKPVLDLTFKCKLGEDIAQVPTFIQEFGSIGYTNCSYKSEAEFYRACLLASLAHGCHGTMWWCAFDQGHFNYAPYRWNNIGSDYGFFDKNLNKKPVADVNVKFKSDLSKIPGEILPAHTTNATVIVPRDDGGADINMLRASYMLAKQANMDVNFCYALDKIPDSPLYIFPSLSTSRAITSLRLDELMEKVNNGAVLYMSIDTALFRRIPQIAGVEFEYRDMINGTKTVNVGDVSLEIDSTYFHKPESHIAQVVGTDENGEGVFFKHSYGKGYVFLLTVPLEKHTAKTKGAFYVDDAPLYSTIYSMVAQCAGVKRIACSDNRQILVTEHKINENEYYIFAINYSNKPQSANITTSGNYSLENVFGKDIENGVLSLNQNDGALFKVKV